MSAAATTNAIGVHNATCTCGWHGGTFLVLEAAERVAAAHRCLSTARSRQLVHSADITWRVGQRVRVRGRLGTIRALSLTTPCVASVDVQLDRDPGTGHRGWICTGLAELEHAPARI